MSVTVAELWDGAALVGSAVTVEPLVVTSPRTADRAAFTVADPAGGPRSGLLVRVGAALDGWPPPVGSSVRLTGIVEVADGPPEIRLFSESDALWLAVSQPPPPSSPGEELEHALVVMDGIRVTSAPDPAGSADTDGAWDLGGRFGVTPGWNREGDLVGILFGDRVSARKTSDWSGELEGDPPLPAEIGELAALDEGTPVVLEGLAQATPWSRDGREMVLQDRAGRGVWVDGELWGLAALTAQGDRGTWIGEVRGPSLRMWEPPVIDGVREPIVGTALEDGAIATLTVSGVGPPDAFGERDAGEVVLDDRFVELVELPDPAELVGAVRVSEGEVRFAPF